MWSARKVLDGIVMILGMWLVISTSFFLKGENQIALASLIILGLAVVVCALWGELWSETAAPEVVNMILGFLLFLSPWILGFSDIKIAAWNAWIVGGAMIFLEILALPTSMVDNPPYHKAP